MEANKGQSDASSLVAAVQEVHQRIKSLLNDIAAGTDREASFGRLAKVAAAHEAAEQQVVHPLAGRAQGGEGVAAERIEEEHKGEELLQQLQKLGTADPGFDALFAQFRSAVLEHAGNEERDEHPILERVLSREESERAAEQFRARSTTA